MKHLCLAAILAAAATMPSVGRADTPAQSSFMQVPQTVAPHVHLLRVPLTYFTDPSGNVEVIEQSDGLIVIDSGNYFGAGQRVVQMIRSISPKPVKALVLTHWHSDHTFGASAVLAAWPNADFIAQEGTIRMMAEGRPPGAPRQRSIPFEQARDKALKDRLAQVTSGIADLTTPWERAGWTQELESLRQRIKDVPGTYSVLPRHAFKDRIDFPDRQAPVQILFLGRANTPGDTLAWLPRQRILITGDIVVAPVPYMFDVFPTEMLTVFKKMRALNARLMIPGHGKPQTPAYLDQLDAMVRDVQAQVAPLAKQNLTVEDVQRRLGDSRWRKALVGDDRWLGFWFGQYTWAPLIKSVVDEDRGEPLGPPPVKPAP